MYVRTHIRMHLKYACNNSVGTVYICAYMCINRRSTHFQHLSFPHNICTSTCFVHTHQALLPLLLHHSLNTHYPHFLHSHSLTASMLTPALQPSTLTLHSSSCVCTVSMSMPTGGSADTSTCFSAMARSASSRAAR